MVFRAKGALHPNHIVIPPPPPQNKRKRGGPVQVITPTDPSSSTVDSPTPESNSTESIASGTEEATVAPPDARFADWSPEAYAALKPKTDGKPQVSLEDATAKAVAHQAAENEALLLGNHPGTDDPRYCPDCYLPLHPDPKPENLYIFLHALRYTTGLGTFETEMPAWAAPDFEWDRPVSEGEQVATEMVAEAVRLPGVFPGKSILEQTLLSHQAYTSSESTPPPLPA